jgi:phosphonate transport system substrate-binding protein
MDAPESLERICMGVVMTMPATRGASVRSPAIPVADFEAFCTVLGDAIGFKVAPCVMPDYATLADALAEGEVDLAWLPPLLALKSARDGATVPLAQPVRGAVNSYSTALISRAGSPYQHSVDLRGAKAAWVDPESASGYIIIRAWMLSQRIDPAVAFSDEKFVGTHEAVVEAVVRGDADVGATYAHVDPFTQAVYASAWGRAPVQVIALAGPIPSDVISASKRLSQQMLAKLQSAFVHNTDRRFGYVCRGVFDAQGFEPANPPHMEMLQELTRYLDSNAIGWRSVPPPAPANDQE